MQRRALIAVVVRPRLLVCLSLGIATIGAVACTDLKYRAALDALVREEVTEDQVPVRLGKTFDVRERGTPKWDAMLEFLSREPPSSYQPLREAVKKYPRILYHTTMWTLTYIFVDDKGVVRGYFVTSQ